MNDLLGGRYRLGNALGRGGMGTVYEAVQEGLGRRVAVKLLDERLSEDREQLERFRREAEVVAALGHPNIVQVTDFQYPDGADKQPFLVMELLRGESLGARIDRESTLSAQRIAFIAAQVLSALSAAHREGVVHRDIKPDNIFLLADAAVPDTVKVLDFGIAKLTGLSSIGRQAKLTGTGAMLGTPAFMAPEQARGDTDIDARADLYAVGATMYQALTGKLPYDAPSIPALLFAIVQKTPVPLRELRPDVPANFIAIVERAMAKDRDARFASADEMRDALAPWSGLPTSTRAPISASESAPTASGGLATAATVATGKIDPYNPTTATPVVVSPTPAPSTAPEPAVSAPPPPAPTRSGPSALALIALVLIVGMVATASVFIVAILKKGDTHEHRDQALERMASSSASAAATTRTEPSTSTSTSASAAPMTIGSHVHVGNANASASAAPATSASVAPPPKAGKRYGGTTGFLSFKDFSGCPSCDWEAFGNEMGMRVPAINACFAASEHEAPMHENPYYDLAVSESGALTLQKAQDGAPNLDRCLLNIVKSVPFKKGSGSFRISFRGECTKEWVGHCD